MPTKVTLAQTYNGQNVDGWWVQPKLDGCRATFDGQSLLSRTGKPFSAPAWWLDELAAIHDMVGSTLDGELIHRDQLTQNNADPDELSGFNSVVSAIRKKVPVDEEWSDIFFYCFDIMEEGTTYEQRYARMWCTIVEGRAILAAVHEYIDVDVDVESLLRVADHNGWEGVMLRNPAMEYEYRRSPNLLKVKPHEDIEAEVIEVVEGTGKYKGMMGALVCQVGDEEFRVGTGFTDHDRSLSDWVGQIITVEFFERTPSGAPRHPRYKGRRNYE